MNIYIAGPMRGIPFFNRAAFERAARKLRHEGHNVFDPVERDISEYGEGLFHNPTGDEVLAQKNGFDLREALADDLDWICRYADAIAMLPGWERSRGARAEHATASALGLRIIMLEDISMAHEYSSPICDVCRCTTPVHSSWCVNAPQPEAAPEPKKECPRCGPDANGSVCGYLDCYLAWPKLENYSFKEAEKATEDPSLHRQPPALLPVDSQERKDTPICTGVFDYFPRALAYVAKVSKAGNDKHNPGQPMHWSKGKSTDHPDCVARHLIERGTIDPEDGLRHSGKLAWRALAILETELEKANG